MIPHPEPERREYGANGSPVTKNRKMGRLAQDFGRNTEQIGGGNKGRHHPGEGKKPATMRNRHNRRAKRQPAKQNLLAKFGGTIQTEKGEEKFRGGRSVARVEE